MKYPIASLSFLAILAVSAQSPCIAETPARIHISDASVRMNPPGTEQTSAYLTLHNTDRNSHALIKVSSPAARTGELHTVVQENGMMKMRPVAKIDIPAGGKTRLKPGGLHIMLIGLKGALKEDDKVSLTLGFDDGTRQTIEAPVKPAMSGMGMEHPHHH